MLIEEERPEPATLVELLDRIQAAAPDEVRVQMGTIVAAVGRRAFGPLLLLAGLITLAPVVGDIPGVPTLMGTFVFLIAGQLLIYRKRFWLPRWLLERSVDRQKLERGIAWLRRPAGFVDRWLRPRLRWFVQGIGLRVVAAVCLAVAAVMPLMEFVPFSANGAGLALTTFGLALVTKDGLLGLAALTLTFTTLGFLAYQLL